MYRRRGGLNARAAHKVQAPQGGQGGQGGGMPAPPGAQHQPQDGTIQTQQVRSYSVVYWLHSHANSKLVSPFDWPTFASEMYPINNKTRGRRLCQ